jgi:hypothetical protein
MVPSGEALWQPAPAAKPGELDDHRDRTALAAFAGGAPVRASDLGVAGTEDSDMAVPVISPSGDVIGIMALRGVPADSLGTALLHDLALIAQWCAKPILARRFERRSSNRIEDPVARTAVHVTPRGDSQEPLEIAPIRGDGLPPSRSN